MFGIQDGGVGGKGLSRYQDASSGEGLLSVPPEPDTIPKILEPICTFVNLAIVASETGKPPVNVLSKLQYFCVGREREHDRCSDAHLSGERGGRNLP